MQESQAGEAVVPALRLSLTAIEHEGMGKGKMQAALTAQRSGVRPPEQGDGRGGAEPADDSGPVASISYEEERAKRVLYADSELHLTVRVGPPHWGDSLSAAAARRVHDSRLCRC